MTAQLKAVGAPAWNEGNAHSVTVELPGVTAEFHRPDVHIPDRDEVTFAVNTVRGYLPSPARVVYYSGLGVLTLLEVIEWPVAAAIGMGVVFAQRADK